jgi:uncharacterized membrane protein (DUF2068 family)
MFSTGKKIDIHSAQKSLLRAVASVEFTKGVLAVLGGVAAILLLHKDTWVMAESLLALFHISTDRRSAQLFLDLADDLTDSRLLWAVRLLFIYSALRFAEGYGLWNQRTWAEWFAFGSGMLLFPFEIRALFHGITILRSAVFAVNLGIVIYMGYLLRDGRRQRKLLRAQSERSAEESP